MPRTSRVLLGACLLAQAGCYQGSLRPDGGRDADAHRIDAELPDDAAPTPEADLPGDAAPTLDAELLDAPAVDGSGSGRRDAGTSDTPSPRGDACAPWECGDGVCTLAESCVSCERDCGACPCGDGRCDRTETCALCPDDCGACPCGDGACDARLGESCVSCAADCGCTCGDGRCDPREWEGCSSITDCGFVDFCGNGLCEARYAEDCLNCAPDCCCR